MDMDISSEMLAGVSYLLDIQWETNAFLLPGLHFSSSPCKLV